MEHDGLWVAVCGLLSHLNSREFLDRRIKLHLDSIQIVSHRFISTDLNKLGQEQGVP
jgi:hypothetical protein